MDICKTDFRKVVGYLDDAARLYDALPMQKCKCRAHMIRQLIVKLKKRKAMKKFIGTKQVSAEPMTLGEFIEKTGRDPYANDLEVHDNNENGYIVEYEGGYMSWSPKDVFEKAYKVAETYVDRMRIEFEELRERMKKLKGFLLSEKSFEVKEDELYDLDCQYDLMNRYARTLLQRIRRAVKPKSEQCESELPTCDCPDCESPSM